MPDGYDFSPYPEPRQPQRYGSFARGVIGGLVDDIYTRQTAQRQQESDARSNALKFLQTLPMSEQNAPIITRMALDILSAKPGKKHWTDQAFGTGKATNQFVDDIWTKLKGILPQDQAESAGAWSEQIPGVGDGARTPVTIGDEIATTYRSPQFGEWANPPLTPIRASRQAVQPGMENPPPLTGFTPPPATRPRRATISMFDYQNQDRARTVTQPADLPDSPMATAAPQRPALDRTRISFANLPGKWKTMTGSYQDAEGQDFLLQVDERTGQTRRIPLGAVSSERQLIAEEAARQRESTAEGNRFKQVVARAAAFAGMDPIAFAQMPAEFKAQYFQLAGQLQNQLDLGLGAQRTATTNLANARVPLAQSQTDLNRFIMQSGGVTPNQQASLTQRNMDAARRFKMEFDELNAKAIAAKQALDAFDNPPPDAIAANIKTPKNLEERRRLQLNYTQAIQQVQQKAVEGPRLFPGMLQGSGTTLSFSPQSTFQGGVNRGAMMAPNAPQFGQPEAMNPATGLPYTATGDLPPAGVIVPPGGQIGGPGAIQPPRVQTPPGGFRGTPPPITMPLGNRGAAGAGSRGSIIVPGTVKNPARDFVPGTTINLGGKQYRVGTVTKPNKNDPYGTVQLTRID